MQLVLFLDAAQDGNRVGKGRLGNEDRLKAPGQRGVLLDVFAVLVERRRTDAVKVAPRQRRLQHVGRVHRALRGARTNQGVQLVDEDDDLTLRRRDLLQDRLDALLELATELRPGNHGTEVERQQPLVAQALRHVTIDDAQGQALDDRRLADSGFTDQHRVVLRAPRQHLDRSSDLLVAADHRVKLALPGHLGEVARVFLQGLVVRLGTRAVGLAALADRFDGLVQRLRRNAGGSQNLASRVARQHCDGKQQALNRDVAVTGLFGQFLGGYEQLRRFARDVEIAATVDAGQLAQGLVYAALGGRGVAAGSLHQIATQALCVVEQDLQHVPWHQLLVPLALCQALGGLDKAPGTFGVFLEVHQTSPSVIPLQEAG